MKPLDLSVWIPSSHRTAEARRAMALLPTATLVVADSERDEYLRAGHSATRLIAHPDLFGLARIRNFIVQRAGTEIVVQVDDDFQSVHAWPGRKRRIYRDPDRLMGIIEGTARLAAEAGARLFGWSNAGKPLYFRPHDPFDFRGPVGRVLGTVGDAVAWDERLATMVDTDATLQELLVNRFVLLDTRFYFHCGAIYGNRGGLQRIRTRELRERDLALMRRKWGPCFDVTSKAKTKGMGTNAIRVVRRM
ncbi:MAG TPA: hypothetical protein PLE19_12625 [Planctomycetota bacterium]|nr:hypothetical protein [Planctomycetota bacterium]HRR83250.1 hypothetical protein [Planctomycetota bacterium]HRT97120.1 hypothetical protein [Planctomycetota bacterium]